MEKGESGTKNILDQQIWANLQWSLVWHSGDEDGLQSQISGVHSRPQRLHSFWSAQRIVTSGQVQHRKSVIRGLPITLLCLQSHSKTECHWTRPEVVILAADQKERGLWGWECLEFKSRWVQNSNNKKIGGRSKVRVVNRLRDRDRVRACGEWLTGDYKFNWHQKLNYNLKPIVPCQHI